MEFHVYYSISGLSLDPEGKFGAVPDSPFKKGKGSIFEQKSGALPALEGNFIFLEGFWQQEDPDLWRRCLILKLPSIMTLLQI